MIFNPEIVIYAYRHGYFPMAEGEMEDIYWHSPNPRAIIPLDNIKKRSRSLTKSIRKNEFKCTMDLDFEQVIRACSDRKDTWISEEIIETYCELNKMGIAHSVETWMGNKIVGGLYGISLGSAFFGESMFNTEADAAKAAFYYLIEYLKSKKFSLLDSQYINKFTEQLGAIEISKREYYRMLEIALENKNLL